MCCPLAISYSWCCCIYFHSWKLLFIAVSIQISMCAMVKSWILIIRWIPGIFVPGWPQSNCQMALWQELISDQWISRIQPKSIIYCSSCIFHWRPSVPLSSSVVRLVNSKIIPHRVYIKHPTRTGHTCPKYVVSCRTQTMILFGGVSYELGKGLLYIYI